jgi:predicted nuclease of predicted toxin-antitoxin system
VKLLIDVNLSPVWVEALGNRGIEAVHWSEIGDLRATDFAIMTWARANGYVVFTHDLDFGSLLAVTGASGPSVIQLRTQDVMPAAIESTLIEVLNRHRQTLESGALVSLDESRARVRILPLRKT